MSVTAPNPRSWHALPTPVLGKWISTVTVPHERRCWEACDAIADCRSVSMKAEQQSGRDSSQPRQTPRMQCVLQASCLTNASTGPDWARFRYGMAGRRAAWREAEGFVTFASHPCGHNIAGRPTRAAMTRTIPSGLLSFDCAGIAADGCSHHRAVPPMQAHEIQWARVAPVQAQIASRPGALRRLVPRWQGSDLESTLDTVAADVANRSFDGSQVILAASDSNGLPLAVNLAAQAASLGLHHTLLLAESAATCSMLHPLDAPACAWSSLGRGLHRHRRALRRYGCVGTRLLWFQRHLYGESASCVTRVPASVHVSLITIATNACCTLRSAPPAAARLQYAPPRY